MKHEWNNGARHKFGFASSPRDMEAKGEIHPQDQI